MIGARAYGHAAQKVPALQPLVSRDLLSVRDFSPEEIKAIFQLTNSVKKRPADFRDALSGKQIVLFFEKASLRTRLTFEASIASLGGTSFFMDQTQARLDEREPLSDVAHPCQALADFFTLQEKFTDLRQVRVAYVGDGNNVAHSLMLAAASVGSKLTIACPSGYAPDREITAAAKAIASETGAQIEIVRDPNEAVIGADAVYTDVWTSMGQENEAAERRKAFSPYQVNEALMALAAPHAIFMHCLPAHRGEEVAAKVIDSPCSVVFDQAENRMHVQKAILLSLLGGEVRRYPSRSSHA